MSEYNGEVLLSEVAELCEAGEYSSALARCDEAWEKAPAHRAGILNIKSFVHERQGALQASEQVLNKALSIDKDYSPALFSLILVQVEAGKIEQALSSSLRLFELEQRKDTLDYTIIVCVYASYCSFKIGKKEEAKGYLVNCSGSDVGDNMPILGTSWSVGDLRQALDNL